MAIKLSRYNPKEGRLNCVACVAAWLRHKADDAADAAVPVFDADDLDHRFGITAYVNGASNLEQARRKAIDKIAEASGLVCVPNPENRSGRPYFDADARHLPAGYYAVFVSPSHGSSDARVSVGHVIGGIVLEPDSHLTQTYDPQSDSPASCYDYPPPRLAVRFAPP